VKVGTRVKIISNIPHQLKTEDEQMGTVTNIDGSYILVRPRQKSYECEFYPNELEEIKECNSLRTL
jgi:hypothetical protein